MVNKTKNKKGRRSPALVAGLVLLFLAIIIIITLAMFASFDEVTNVFEAGKVDIVLVEDKWDPSNGDNIVPNAVIDKNPAILNKEDTVETSVFLKVIVPYEDDPNFIIEYADQDDKTKSGKEYYNNGIATPKSQPVPIYKFVATGEKYYPKEGDDPAKAAQIGVTYDGDLYGENCTNQKINPGWKLLEGYPEKDESLKAYIYVYAHVNETPNEEGKYDLKPLIAGSTTEYPLFNQIYLLNFRERDIYEKDEFGNYKLDIDKQKIPTGSTSVFPDPARNYSIRIEAYGIQTNFLKENNTTTLDPDDVWKNYINKESGS